MSRPDRRTLTKQFFQELGQTVTKADTEAQIALNTRACEVILNDHIKAFDRFYQDMGPGVLCINLANKGSEAYYLSADDCLADMKVAKELGDASIHDMLDSTLKQIDATNFREFILVQLIDNSRSSLLPVSRNYPAKGIQAIQEALTT